MPLPRLFLSPTRNLCANLTTSAGLETFVGPVAAADVWFAFGIAIGPRSVLL
jgi:hypothetical protein